MISYVAMVKEHKSVTIPPEEWPALLTPEMKTHFEYIGEELVLRDVSNHRYSSPEKHFAAAHWLGEIRKKRDDRAKRVSSIATATLIVATLTFIASIVALCT